MRELGLPPDHPFDQAYFTRLSRHEIFRFPMPNRVERIAMRRDMPVTDQLPEPMFHVNQMYVERFLLQKARAAPNIDVRFGWEAQWFTQDETQVRVHACKTDGSAEATWVSQFAVGCDGARGFIRRTLGIPYEGDVQKKDAYWAGQFFSIHMRIPDLYPRFVGHRRAWMYWAVNPDPSTRGVIIALDGIDEFMMLVKPKAGHTDVDKAEVAQWVQRSIGEDVPVHVIGYYPWHAGQALVAERYKAGRIMIAGDAAHVFTPTGGFGMNTGIDDSANLAWKLAAVLQGWGGDKLLDTYQIERKPIGYRNTGASRKYASMMHDAVVPDDVEAEGPAGDAARIAASNMTYVRKNHFVRPEDHDAVGVQIGGRYDGSPIIVPDGEPPADIFPQTYDFYVPSGVPGGRAPHLWLDAERVMGSSLFDRFGKGFTLLRLNGNTANTECAGSRRRTPRRSALRSGRCRAGGERALRTQPRTDPARPIHRLARRPRAGRSRCPACDRHRTLRTAHTLYNENAPTSVGGCHDTTWSRLRRFAACRDAAGAIARQLSQQARQARRECHARRRRRYRRASDRAEAG